MSTLQIFLGGGGCLWGLKKIFGSKPKNGNTTVQLGNIGYLPYLVAGGPYGVKFNSPDGSFPTPYGDGYGAHTVNENI